MDLRAVSPLAAKANGRKVGDHLLKILIDGKQQADNSEWQGVNGYFCIISICGYAQYDRQRVKANTLIPAQVANR